MESIETLFQNQVKSTIEWLSYHLNQIRALNPHTTPISVYKMSLFKNPKGQLTSTGQIYLYGGFESNGLSRVYRTGNKTYPSELAKVKKFFENNTLSRLIVIPVPFKSFLESAILSSNASYRDSVVLHPIFMEKLEELLNERKLILTSGKFSSKAFIWNSDVGLNTLPPLWVANATKEILNQDISLDTFIKIIEDINNEYKNLDYQFRVLNQKQVTQLNYAENTANAYKMKHNDAISQLQTAKAELYKLKNQSDTPKFERPETKITTSRAMTWG